MARLLCRNLSGLIRPSPAARLFDLRRFSDQSWAVQVLQFDLADEGDASSAAAAASIIDEVVQSILVHRSTPDWLPFVPGASFWVPPRKSLRVVVGVEGGSEEWLAAEEAPSYPSSHGWPSLSYFVEGKFSQPIMTSRHAKIQSDDDSS